MRNKRPLAVVLLCCAVSVIASETSAQTHGRAQAKTVVPVEVFKDAPRQIGVFAQGPKGRLGVVDANERVTLLGEHLVIKSLGSESRWERIAFQNRPGSRAMTGWVYAGEVNGRKTLVSERGAP